MRAVLPLAVVAVPMGVLLSRTMAWMSSGKTQAELTSRLRGKRADLRDTSFHIYVVLPCKDRFICMLLDKAYVYIYKAFSKVK